MIAAAAPNLTAGQPESVRQTDSAIRTEAVFISPSTSWWQRLGKVRRDLSAHSTPGVVVIAAGVMRARGDSFLRPCNTAAPPAQFFLCPRRPRHAQNTRGLRLVWLLAINNQLRRAA